VARKSSLDRSVVDMARERLKSAKTADELRRAQAVALPDIFGIDLERAGAMIGKSRTSVARLRTEFLSLIKGKEPPRKNWGGRRRQNMKREDEDRLLMPFFETAKKGAILVVAPVKEAYERAVGHQVPESTVYRLLARHGWRKLAPDKRHPKTDPLAQEEFKKNSPQSSGPKKS
jgi:hypothetical protein